MNVTIAKKDTTQNQGPDGTLTKPENHKMFAVFFLSPKSKFLFGSTLSRIVS